MCPEQRKKFHLASHSDSWIIIKGLFCGSGLLQMATSGGGGIERRRRTGQEVANNNEQNEIKKYKTRTSKAEQEPKQLSGMKQKSQQKRAVCQC